MEQSLTMNAKKIIIKIGSDTLTAKDGSVDIDFLKSLSAQVKTLLNEGKRVIIVSSGARMAGVSAINKWSRKEDINYKQALCAIGQVELMGAYRKIFLDDDLHIAQVLLTREDFESENRNIHIRNTLFTLIDEGVVPVVNENDTVCVEEIKIGDNDMLAARTGTLWGADLAIMLSNIDGIYTSNPKTDKNAKHLEFIDDIAEAEKFINTDGKSDFGTGGVATKIQAAKLLNKYGCALVICHGKAENPVLNAINRTSVSTLIADFDYGTVQM